VRGAPGTAVALHQNDWDTAHSRRIAFSDYLSFYLPVMADDALDARRGNLYGISTLSGNWYEDRIQQTKGSTTDGLRGDKFTFEDGVGNSVVRQKESAISVCLIPDKNSGKAVGIAAAERYRRAANNPTTRVFPGCKEGTLATTSTYQESFAHGSSKYVNADVVKKSMLLPQNFHESLKERSTRSNPKYYTGADMSETHGIGLICEPTKVAKTEYFSSTRSVYAPQVVNESQPAAGFTEAYISNAPVLPLDVPEVLLDPWGRNRKEYANHPARHHVRSSCVLFEDARGRDPPRLGITIPGDEKAQILPFPSTQPYERVAKKAGPFGRKAIIAMAPKDMEKASGGARVFFDDKL
jgi:hypothetical protein